MAAASFHLFWPCFCFYTYRKLRKYFCIVTSNCTHCMPYSFKKVCWNECIFYVKTDPLRLLCPHTLGCAPLLCRILGAPLSETWKPRIFWSEIDLVEKKIVWSCRILPSLLEKKTVRNLTLKCRRVAKTLSNLLLVRLLFLKLQKYTFLRLEF